MDRSWYRLRIFGAMLVATPAMGVVGGGTLSGRAAALGESAGYFPNT